MKLLKSLEKLQSRKGVYRTSFFPTKEILEVTFLRDAFKNWKLSNKKIDIETDDFKYDNNILYARNSIIGISDNKLLVNNFILSYLEEKEIITN